MADAEQRSSVGVVAGVGAQSAQRFVERLNRSGIEAHTVVPDVLATEARAGQLYLAPLELSASAEAAAQRGAHICLIPPWPTGVVRIGGATASVAEAAQRGAVCYTTQFADVKASQSQDATSWKILYRERLIGAFGVVLAASETGEPLLATLPRASNRHGYLVVTSLQMSVASAQTRLEDVGRLLERLYAWCRAHAEPLATQANTPGDDPNQPDRGEEFAPLVVLALALQRPTLATTEGTPEHVRIDSVRSVFAQICGALGLALEPRSFDMGWAWLAAHEVVSPVEDDGATIDSAAIERYSSLWQLGPRLRRLRRIGDGMQSTMPSQRTEG